MTNTPDTKTPWLQEGWLESVQDWIQGVLAPQGITITGPLEQFHAYPWSTVLRIPTQSGPLFFKASAGFSAHEASLTAFLSPLHPEQMPRLVAFNQDLGWMIMHDGGQRLREQLQAQLNWGHWETLLPL